MPAVLPLLFHCVDESRTSCALKSEEDVAAAAEGPISSPLAGDSTVSAADCDVSWSRDCAGAESSLSIGAERLKIRDDNVQLCSAGDVIEEPSCNLEPLHELHVHQQQQPRQLTVEEEDVQVQDFKAGS